MPKLLIRRITSRPERQSDTVGTPTQPFGTGQKQERLDLPERLGVKDITTSQTFETIVEYKTAKKIKVVRLPPKEPYSTRESVVTNRNQTLTDKSSFSKRDTQQENSIPTWDPVSTITEGGYNVSWEKSHQELSRKLWLPTRTDCADTALNFSNGSSENILSSSWFSVMKSCQVKGPGTPSILKSSPRTSWTSVTTLSPNTTGRSPDNTDAPGNSKKTGEMLRMRKYLVHPDNLTKRKLKEALEATRYLYNRSVQLLSENPEIKVNLKTLRRLLITDCDENILPSQIRQEFRKVPYDVRDGAIRDFIKAFGTQKKLVALGQKRYFKMSYMSRHYRSIVINHKHFRDLGEKEITAFPHSWGGKMYCKEGFPEIEHDARLVKRQSRYYLFIPTTQDIPKKVRTGQVVGLDPGVRSFQTTYGTDGKSYSIGKDCISKIDRISQIASRLREGIKRIKQSGKKMFKEVKKSKGMSRKSKKLEESVKNRISDIHRNTCKFLCSQYDVVVLPEFRSQKISEKKDSLGNWKRKIGKTTTREMIRWGHFSFRSLLIAKGIQTGTKVVIGTEEYTSKTCTNCLKINYNLGSDKIFRCTCCSLVIDRDINGARNILLKNWEKARLSYKPVRLVTLNRLGLPSSRVTDKVQTNSEVSKLSV